MRRPLLFMATTALVMLVACGVALAASVDCPTASGGVCDGTNQGDALYGTPNVDREFGKGGSDLMYGYGDGDFMYGGDEAGVGDKMRGGNGPDLVNGQGGNDIIYGGPGSDTLKTGRGSDRIEAKDGNKDFITCKGTNDLVIYDRGLDVLEGCAVGSTTPGQPVSPLEPGTKVLVDHKGKKELCLPEAALGDPQENGHLKHGDEVLSWEGCSDTEGGRKGLR
jgi:RTX calcium-binding nonapeptide repeat (4 copies)